MYDQKPRGLCDRIELRDKDKVRVVEKILAPLKDDKNKAIGEMTLYI